MATRAKGTRPLVISDPTLMVRRANERLVMMRERKEVAAVPLRDIAHVALHGPVTVTGAAMAGILDEGIEVTLYSTAGFFRGLITSAQSKNVYLMLAQVDAWKRDERRLAFARSLLAGKIAGQRAMVHRHALDRGSAGCREAASRLKELERAVAAETDVDGARGVEGAAAAQYFNVFGEMLSEPWVWEGRRHRPAPDPVNAALSFGYALATGEMTRTLVVNGFDTRVGLVHGLRYGRESLALDLVEEFRAPLVDRFVLRMLNRKQLTPESFEAHEGGSVRFTSAGKRSFLEAWEEMMGASAPALRNEQVVPGDRERAEAQRIERPWDEVDGKGGRKEREEDREDDREHAEEGGRGTATWRGRMGRQVQRLRRFLMRGEPYLPMTTSERSGKKGGGGSQRRPGPDNLPEEP